MREDEERHLRLAPRRRRNRLFSGAGAFGPGGDIGYGGMGMGVTGQGAFGDLGASGTGYGDTY